MGWFGSKKSKTSAEMVDGIVREFQTVVDAFDRHYEHLCVAVDDYSRATESLGGRSTASRKAWETHRLNGLQLARNLRTPGDLHRSLRDKMSEAVSLLEGAGQREEARRVHALIRQAQERRNRGEQQLDERVRDLARTTMAACKSRLHAASSALSLMDQENILTWSDREFQEVEERIDRAIQAAELMGRHHTAQTWVWRRLGLEMPDLGDILQHIRELWQQSATSAKAKRHLDGLARDVAERAKTPTRVEVFLPLIQLAMAMIHADGKVDAAEVRVARQGLVKALVIPQAEMPALKEAMKARTRPDSVTLGKTIRELVDPGELSNVMVLLVAIAKADGLVAPEEMEILRQASRGMGWSESRFAEFAQEHRLMLRAPWSILGLAQGASAAEVKAAYRAKMKSYHPDRVNQLPEEFQKLAHQKSLEIQEAYAALR